MKRLDAQLLKLRFRRNLVGELIVFLLTIIGVASFLLPGFLAPLSEYLPIRSNEVLYRESQRVSFLDTGDSLPQKYAIGYAEDSEDFILKGRLSANEIKFYLDSTSLLEPSDLLAGRFPASDDEVIVSDSFGSNIGKVIQGVTSLFGINCDLKIVGVARVGSAKPIVFADAGLFQRTSIYQLYRRHLKSDTLGVSEIALSDINLEFDSSLPPDTVKFTGVRSDRSAEFSFFNQKKVFVVEQLSGADKRLIINPASFDIGERKYVSCLFDNFEHKVSYLASHLTSELYDRFSPIEINYNVKRKLNFDTNYLYFISVLVFILSASSLLFVTHYLAFDKELDVICPDKSAINRTLLFVSCISAFMITSVVIGLGWGFYNLLYAGISSFNPLLILPLATAALLLGAITYEGRRHIYARR